jgi:hypothetical protein
MESCLRCNAERQGGANLLLNLRQGNHIVVAERT